MLLAAALFLLGHLVALFFFLPPAMAAATLPILFYLVHASNRPPALMLALGYLLAGSQVSTNLDGQLPGSQNGEMLSVTGWVSGLPHVEPGATRFEFSTLTPAPLNLPRRIQVSWYRPDQVPSAGEVWRLKLRLRRPRGGVNPDGFDYEKWLFRRGIGATAYVVNRADNKRLHDSTSLAARLLQLRASIADRLEILSGDKRWRGMIAGVAIGDRRLISDRQWRTLRETGTAHLMAISGLHVGMTAAFAGGAGLACWILIPPLRRRFAMKDTAMAVGIAAAAAYSLLAGFSLPTRRALIMLAVCALVGWLRRSPTTSRAIGLALVAVLIADPMAPLDPGFWLSFSAVACLALALSGRLPEPRRWQRWSRNMLLAQFAVGLGLLPLTIGFFGLSAPAGLVANLILIPLFGLYFVPLTLALLVAMLLEFETGMSIAIGGLEKGLGLVWPWLQFLIDWLPAARVPVPSWIAIGLAIAGVIYLLAPCWPGRWLGILMFLPLLAPGADRIENGDLRVLVLDVGQGLAVVVETRHRLLVYDPGPRYASGGDAATRVLLPYLEGIGRKEIDIIVVSHGDIDHAGALDVLREAYPLANIIAGGGKRSPRGTVPCRAGQRWQWDDVNFEILHPDSTAWQGNNASCVLLIETQHCRIILTGDIQREAERRLYGRVGAVDVALVAHHGSNTSSTARWVAELNPSLALVSASFDNRWHFPTPEVTRRWLQSGATLANTGTDGALTIDIDAKQARIRLRRERHASRHVWRERLHSAAGPVDPATASTVSGPAPAAVSCRDSRHH